MENSELADICLELIDSTSEACDIDGFLSAACQELNLRDWQSLAGFLLHLDDAFTDAVEPKIRGCSICRMENLRFGPQDWVLIYLRQENASFGLRSPELSKAICPETEVGRAVSWALTTFWHTNRRTEVERVSKRHFGIPDCN